MAAFSSGTTWIAVLVFLGCGATRAKLEFCKRNKRMHRREKGNKMLYLLERSLESLVPSQWINP